MFLGVPTMIQKKYIKPNKIPNILSLSASFGKVNIVNSQSLHEHVQMQHVEVILSVPVPHQYAS